MRGGPCQIKSKGPEDPTTGLGPVLSFSSRHHNACILPAVCEEGPVGVSGAVAPWGGTTGPLCLEGLPVEGRAI